MKPNILNADFLYTNSASTDVAKTFAKFRDANRDKRNQADRAWAQLETHIKTCLENEGLENVIGLAEKVWAEIQDEREAAVNPVDYEMRPPLDDQFVDDPRHGQAAEINAKRGHNSNGGT